jgi:hypothetical protein
MKTNKTVQMKISTLSGYIGQAEKIKTTLVKAYKKLGYIPEFYDVIGKLNCASCEVGSMY